MKRVMVITNYTSLENEKGYNRFRYICEFLSELGFKTMLVTSRFDHYSKSFRDVKRPQARYEVVLLNELGYSSNISLKRVISQKLFAHNLKRFLYEVNEKIDYLYVCVPSLEAAKVAGKFAKKKNIKFVIDVQDLWPEAMRMVLKNSIFTDILLYPMKRAANRVYSMADKIIAVSDEYVQRAKEVNKNVKQGLAVYIGTPSDVFNEGIEQFNYVVKKEDDEFWLVYTGTLGTSYDIETLIDAYALILEKGYKNIKLKVLGRGPLEDTFRQHAASKNIDVDFVGFLEYGHMACYLHKSDIAINPIVKHSASSIVNKVGDYFTAGLPVLNSSKSKEMRALICDYNVGFNYEPGDVKDLAEKILILYNNSTQREEIRNNVKRLASEKFDRSSTYLKIVDVLKD